MWSAGQEAVRPTGVQGRRSVEPGPPPDIDAIAARINSANLTGIEDLIEREIIQNLGGPASTWAEFDRWLPQLEGLIDQARQSFFQQAAARAVQVLERLNPRTPPSSSPPSGPSPRSRPRTRRASRSPALPPTPSPSGSTPAAPAGESSAESLDPQTVAMALQDATERLQSSRSGYERARQQLEGEEKTVDGLKTQVRRFDTDMKGSWDNNRASLRQAETLAEQAARIWEAITRSATRQVEDGFWQAQRALQQNFDRLLSFIIGLSIYMEGKELGLASSAPPAFTSSDALVIPQRISWFEGEEARAKARSAKEQAEDEARDLALSEGEKRRYLQDEIARANDTRSKAEGEVASTKAEKDTAETARESAVADYRRLQGRQAQGRRPAAENHGGEQRRLPRDAGSRVQDQDRPQAPHSAGAAQLSLTPEERQLADRRLGELQRLEATTPGMDLSQITQDAYNRLGRMTEAEWEGLLQRVTVGSAGT